MQPGSSKIRVKKGPCNGIRQYLVKKGVRVINIDECRTSKNCCRCGEQMRKSRLVEYENGSFSTSNGILSWRVCQMSLNRDINGAINIHHLVCNHLNNLERPTWLPR